MADTEREYGEGSGRMGGDEQRGNIRCRAYSSPDQINLELTTRCPLRCPQCYCELSGGKDMPPDTALYWLEEAARNHVSTVNLSGGETMLYPDLEKLVETCSRLGMESNIAISGYGASRERLRRLIDCGVSRIFVSLNGSTEEINSLSRDGYELAVDALRTLQEMHYGKTFINWVMHSHNTADFPNLIRLAETYGAAAVAVMVFKPDAAYQRKSMPCPEQIRWMAELIRKYQGPIEIVVESCFSQLRALLGDSYFVNPNRGIAKGCGAGRDGISVSVDGRLTPCRHLPIEESFETIREYWESSDVLRQLREVENAMEEPCRSCRYHRFCLPCMAVSWKMKGKLCMGEESCGLWKPCGDRAKSAPVQLADGL